MFMYKKLGLSSEEVSEIGKWKSTGAFTTHYLRVGASQKASTKLNSLLVHSASSGGSAAPDQSRTPGTKRDTGGSDWEGEAQSPDEATLPTPGLWDCSGDLACPPLSAGLAGDIASRSVEVSTSTTCGKQAVLSK